MATIRQRPVGIIGAGRVGTALGARLRRAGYRVVAVAARSATARARAERTLAGVPVREPAAVARASETLLVTVTDDAIAGVVHALAGHGVLHEGQYVVHASGAHGLDVLAAATAQGAAPFALHPAMTFPESAPDLEQWDDIPFAVTCLAAHRPEAETLVRDLGGVPVWIDDRDRALYHAGLVLGANNLVTLIAAARDALTAAGVADPGFVLSRLTRAALAHALRDGDQALTGPVRRGDVGTVAAHVRALRAHAPDLVDGYLRFGLETAKRAQRADLGPADGLHRVAELLAGQLPGPGPEPDSETTVMRSRWCCG